MKTHKILILAALLFSFTSFIGVSQTSDQKSKINIENKEFQDLDGAYSVVSVNDEGKTQQFNIKFKKGKIVSIAIDGEELPRDKWLKKEKLIKEYISYIEPRNQKSYKYQDVYEFEKELKKDLEKLEKTIQELEISKRFEKFYNEELKHWMDELEHELNNSELIDEMEDVLKELSKELDRFLYERREYSKKDENKKKQR